MDPRDVHKTTFITRNGTQCFQAMPLASSVPETDECRVVRSKSRHFVGLPEQHRHPLGGPLVSYRKYGKFSGTIADCQVEAEGVMCRLLQREIHFLGHVVSESAIGMDRAKLEAVTSWPVPHNLKDVRFFIGLYAWFREFVPNLSALAVPYTICPARAICSSGGGPAIRPSGLCARDWCLRRSSRCPLTRVDSFWT